MFRHAAHTTDQLLLLAAEQEPYKKAYPVSKILKNFLEKKVRRMGQQKRKRKEKKDKTNRVTGYYRRTREEIVQWNQMTSLRLQTGVWGGGDINHSRPSVGVSNG